MFDISEAEAYLARRFVNLQGYIAMAVRFNGKSWTEHQYQWPEEKSRLLANVKELEDKRADIYICPVLRKDRGRDKWNGLGSHTVFADLDGGEIPAVLLPYTELISSGTADHFHAYITLSDLVSVGLIEALSYALTKVSHGDPGKWSANTVLRLPGTVNYKFEPHPVFVVQYQDKLISSDELASALKYYLPVNQTSYPTEAEVDELTDIQLPEKLDWYLMQRLEDSIEGDRSNKSYHFLVACVEKGLKANLIYSLALRHPPTVAKYGGRTDGIKNQVLTVIKNASASQTHFLENLHSWNQ